MALREDEILDQLVCRMAQRQIDADMKADALKRLRKERERALHGVDDAPQQAVVEVREDAEARSIADSPIPGIPKEWAEWERDALDPTKDL